MLRGKRLLPGDTIGIVAPASHAGEDRIQKAVSNLTNLGYRVLLGKSCTQRWYSYAGRDETRAADLNDFFRVDAVDAIMCLRGGYGSLRLLDRLDLAMIAEHPKVFIGYSDITCLHLVFNQKVNLITFHGPMLTSNFADGPDPVTGLSLTNVVCAGNRPPVIQNATTSLKALAGGVAEGQIIGGNLTTLMSMLGTPYAPYFQDKILFMEDVGEATYRIDRALTQLLLMGELQKLKGIILGDFHNCRPAAETDMTLTEVFQDRLGCLGIPVLMGLESGHCRPLLTLPLGALARINGDEARIEFLEPVVE